MSGYSSDVLNVLAEEQGSVRLTCTCFQDLAARDATSAEKYGNTTTKRSNPMVPLLSLLPPP
jgi:hypothetical protein